MEIQIKKSVDTISDCISSQVNSICIPIKMEGEVDESLHYNASFNNDIGREKLKPDRRRNWLIDEYNSNNYDNEQSYIKFESHGNWVIKDYARIDLW